MEPSQPHHLVLLLSHSKFWTRQLNSSVLVDYMLTQEKALAGDEYRLLGGRQRWPQVCAAEAYCVGG